ncbi:Transcription factor IIIB 50 kDa subunit, partial [Lamprotornis superbus]
VAYSQSTGQKEQLSRCLQRGIRRVQDLCKVLQLPAVFEETAVSYFQRALQLPAFRLVSLEKKELLGGCCVFVTCRQHNWPLTMGTICSLLYAKQDLFASVYLSLQKELGLSVPALSLADLPTANIPAVFLEDKEKLLARTMAIGSVGSGSPDKDCLDKGSPGQGSLGPDSLDKDSLDKDSPDKGSPGQVSPGQGSVGPSSLDKDSPDKGSPGQGSVGPGSLDKDSSGKDSLDKDKNSLDKDSLDNGSPGQGSPSSPPGTQQQGCPWAGKGQRGGTLRPLLPPCLIHPRKRLRPSALSAPAVAPTGDEPILDSEIEQYLRSPEEIRALSKAKAWL